MTSTNERRDSRKRVNYPLLLGTALCLIAAACNTGTVPSGAATSQPTDAITTPDASATPVVTNPPVAKVRVAGVPSTAAFAYHVALAEGIFEKHFIEIEEVQSLESTAALLAGEVDVTYNAVEAAVIAAAQGKPLPIIVMSASRNNLSLHVRSDVEMPNLSSGYPEMLKDLRGKIIATTSPQGGGAIFLQNVLAGADMAVDKDYTILAVGAGENLLNALRAKRVEASLLYPPFTQISVLEGLTRSLVDQLKGEGPEIVSKAAGLSLQTSPEFLGEQPDVLRRFVAAVEEATEFIRDLDSNEDRLVELMMSDLFGITDRAVAAAAVQDQATISYPGVNCEALQFTAQRLLDLGTIENKPDCADMIAEEVASEGPMQPAN